MDERQLSERKRRILKAIIDAHISNGEPVGSKFLAQSDEITCSPATIRNEMAELEDMGYLIQPHCRNEDNKSAYSENNFAEGCVH